MTYISLEAQLKDISLRNRKATAELEEMLEQSPPAEIETIDNPPIPFTEPSGSSFWLISAVCAAAGLAAGVMLTGWII